MCSKCKPAKEDKKVIAEFKKFVANYVKIVKLENKLNK